MNYSRIKYCDIANGTGIRTTLFVSGCRNHCNGCFQPETWDFNYGKPFTDETLKEIIDNSNHDYIAGLTVLGGEPFEEENQKVLVKVIEEFKNTYPNKNIWCFTGYIIDDLLSNGKKHTKYTDTILSNIDVLVEGPFILEKKNLCLKFRGSDNQRIIDMNEFRKTGKIVDLC